MKSSLSQMKVLLPMLSMDFLEISEQSRIYVNMIACFMHRYSEHQMQYAIREAFINTYIT